MTNAEYFNKVTETQEKPHIQAFKSIVAELGDEYPDINQGELLLKYKSMVEWLNFEKPVSAKEVQQ